MYQVYMLNCDDYLGTEPQAFLTMVRLFAYTYLSLLLQKTTLLQGKLYKHMILPF